MKSMTTLFAIAIAALAVASPAVGANYTVDPGGSGDFTTIQAAINAAGAGDTINVNAGTYDEAISMNKPLKLIGNSAVDTIITYTTAGSKAAVEQNFFLGDNDGEDFTGFSTLVENFTFRNGGNLTGDNDLIKFRARGIDEKITIRNNVFDGDDSSTVKAIEESQGTTNFEISNNSFVGLRYGMYLNNAHDGDVDGNTFDGMSSGSIAFNPDPDGIHVPGGSRNINVTGNTMENGNFGILLGDGNQDLLIQGNIIRDHTGSIGAGILYWDDEGDHQVTNDGEFESDNIVIFCNDIFGNDVGIRGYVDSANPPAPQNTWDATDNWWGHASGPSGLGSGSGDSVVLQNVDFSNWASGPKVIPEPSSLLLLAIGGVGILPLRRLRRR